MGLRPEGVYGKDMVSVQAPACTENQGFPYKPVGAKTALDPDQSPTGLHGLETGYSARRRHARVAPTGGAGFVPISPFYQARL